MDQRFLAASEADRLFAALLTGIDWRCETVRVFGRTHLVPRRVAWHGDPGACYRYSGVVRQPQPWNAPLVALRRRLAEELGLTFNSVLLNLYRDGGDGMGWHSDDERELGPQPVIASLSLGAARRFLLRHRRHPALRAELTPGHGSLLLMRGVTQQHWRHAVPKTRRPVGARINLTFRRIQVAETA